MGLILLRYGELALKGRNRPAFIRRLRRNLRDALKQNHDIVGTVRSVGQRVYVETDQVEAGHGAYQPRLWAGVGQSCHRGCRATWRPSLPSVRARPIRAGVGPHAIFSRVRARRADRTFPYISPQIDRLAGEEPLCARPTAWWTSSRNADVTIGVEITAERVLVFGQTVACPGGLPLGVEGRVIALMSGGIDSPVAAWMMMKRGCAIIPVHFAQNETEESQGAGQYRGARQSYSYGFKLRPIVLDHHEVIAPTLDQADEELGDERWSCVFCKRALLTQGRRVGRRTARQRHCDGRFAGPGSQPDVAQHGGHLPRHPQADLAPADRL